MEKKNNLSTLSILIGAFIISIINELLLRMTSIIVFQYSVHDPVFFIDHGYYFYIEYLNIYVFVLIQFIILSLIFIIFGMFRKIKISYKLIIVDSLFISFISYYFSSPKVLNLFAFITNYTFSIYNFGALIFHIFAVSLLIYIFFIRYYR